MTLTRRLRTKRVYDPASEDDGFRVLVDRVWPRGVRKTRVDLWLPSVAPSTELRQWFGHDPEKWPEFKRRYFCELEGRSADLRLLSGQVGLGLVTLFYSARDRRHNQAVALEEYLMGWMEGRDSGPVVRSE